MRSICRGFRRCPSLIRSANSARFVQQLLCPVALQWRDDLRLRKFAEFVGEAEVAEATLHRIEQPIARERMQQGQRCRHVEAEILAERCRIHARRSRRQPVDARNHAFRAAAQLFWIEAEIELVGDQRAGFHGVPRLLAKVHGSVPTATKRTATARVTSARGWQVRVAGWIRSIASRLREHPLWQQRETGVGGGADDPSFSTAESPPATPLPIVFRPRAGSFASLPCDSFAWSIWYAARLLRLPPSGQSERDEWRPTLPFGGPEPPRCHTGSRRRRPGAAACRAPVRRARGTASRDSSPMWWTICDATRAHAAARA